MKVLLAAAVLGCGVLVPAPAAAAVPAPAPAGPSRTGKVIVLRPGYAELVQGGAVRRYVRLPYGPVGIAALVRRINAPTWARLSGRGELVLRAGISQRPGTDLRVEAPVRTVRLVDSASSPAFLSGTHASVVFRRVTVTSGPAPESPHRPYIRYLNRSTVSALSSTFEGLGSATTRNHGVTIGSGGVLSAVDSVFRAGSRGIDVYRAARVTLTRVTATGNTEAGVLVNQAGAVALTDVTASDNTGTGLLLRGPLPAPALARVSSERNRTGVELSRLGAVPVGPLRTDHNRHSGIVLDRCPGCVLTGVEAVGDRVGVLVERKSPGALVRDSTVRSAGQRGVTVAADGVRLRGLTVESAPWGVGLRVFPGVRDVTVETSTVRRGAVGISTDGIHTAITGVSVTGAQIGLRLGREAAEATVTGVDMADTRTGLQANAGSRAVTVSRLRVTQHGGQGVRSAAQPLSISDSQVAGAAVGLHLKGVATVHSSTVAGAEEAVVAGPRGRVTFVGGALRGEKLGLDIAASSHVLLQDTTVDAPQGARGPIQLRGSSELPALPVRWIAIFGLVVIAAAIVLEVVRRLRERRTERTVSAPPHVTNIA